MTAVAEVQLDSEQQTAVDCDNPAIVVTAGAGCGKTEVVSRRVERLLEASAPSNTRVLSLSYTVKAAEELRSRFDKRLGDAGRRVDTDTVHGFAHSLLRKSGTWIGLPAEPEVLARDEDRVELLARWLADEGEEFDDERAQDALRSLDLARARCEEDPTGLLPTWRAALDASGALDYPAMVEKATELVNLPAPRRQLGRLYEHAIIDEAQNLTPAQYRLLTAVFGPPPLQVMHVMMVGDDKQSIVQFAGADRGLMARFANDYGARRFHLGRNYRSAQKIVRLASKVAHELGHAGPPDTVTYPAPGEIKLQAVTDEHSEGELIGDWVSGLLSAGLPRHALVSGEEVNVRPEHIAVLGRTAASLRASRLALEARGIEAAVAVRMEDWLTTKGGRVVLEMVAIAAADHASPRWRLGGLIGADESDLTELSSVGRHLASRADALHHLGALCDADGPGELITALSDVRINDDPDWEADRIQLADAWNEFCRRTDAGARSWANFHVFLTRIQRSHDLTEGVRLLTVHKAQGREYRAVAVVGLNAGQFPDFRARTREEQTSELRAFYVAVSRPTRVLLLTRARQRMTRIGPRATEPSPYLEIARDYGSRLL